MPEKIIIGADPGKTGALVAIDSCGMAFDSIAADDSGSYVVGREYVPRALVEWLEDLKSRSTICLVVIEAQSSRPPEGRTSALTTGYGFGLLVGIVSALGIPYEVVSPASWSRSVFGGQGKKTSKERKARSIQFVSARVPSLSLVLDGKRVPHHGLADAACLALHGWSNFAGSANLPKQVV